MPGTIADAGDTSETNHNKVLTDLELTCLCVCACVRVLQINNKHKE